MKWLDAWRERRDKAWWEKWHRVHRWDKLADYNGAVGRGIVHTPEYKALMAVEQRLFNEERQ